jgi:hypothetical protein
MALVEAAKFFTFIEASLAHGRLGSEGIASVLFDTNMNWGGADLGVVPVRLMVDEEDLDAARRLLSALDKGEADRDRSPPPGPWR